MLGWNMNVIIAERILITYKDYLKTHDSKLGDCCHKCEGIKYKKTMQEKIWSG